MCIGKSESLLSGPPSACDSRRQSATPSVCGALTMLHCFGRDHNERHPRASHHHLVHNFYLAAAGIGSRCATPPDSSRRHSTGEASHVTTALLCATELAAFEHTCAIIPHWLKVGVAWHFTPCQLATIPLRKKKRYFQLPIIDSVLQNLT